MTKRKKIHFCNYFDLFGVTLIFFYQIMNIITTVMFFSHSTHFKSFLTNIKNTYCGDSQQKK